MAKEKCKCGNGHIPPAGCLHNCYKCCAGKGGIATNKSSSGSNGNLNRLRRGGFTNFDGDTSGSMSTMSVGAYALSMLSVGVLFFVIGYGYFKGKESA